MSATPGGTFDSCASTCTGDKAGFLQLRNHWHPSCDMLELACAQGTKLVFYDSKADVLLLDIPESIPDHFHAYKVGFDAAEDAPARAVAIHQPHGNIKRISYANDS